MRVCASVCVCVCVCVSHGALHVLETGLLLVQTLKSELATKLTIQKDQTADF